MKQAVSGTCCFVAGTLVETKDGLRAIETIQIGDLVLSRDETTGETEFKPVTELIRRHNRIVWKLTLSVPNDDGKAKTIVFETTDDHPWRTAAGVWAKTMELRPGVEVLRARGPSANVVSVENTGKGQPTFNMEVDDYHTYFVGEDRVWVHNARRCGGRSDEAQGRADTNAKRGIPPSKLGPSGHPKVHNVKHNTLKSAKDAARSQMPKGGRTRKDSGKYGDMIPIHRR